MPTTTTNPGGPQIPSDKRTVSSKVTNMELTGIGALGGSAEVCLLQPMMAFKNALQEGRPIPKNPVHIYRGLTVRVCACGARVPLVISTSALFDF